MATHTSLALAVGIAGLIVAIVILIVAVRRFGAGSAGETPSLGVAVPSNAPWVAIAATAPSPPAPAPARPRVESAPRAAFAGTPDGSPIAHAAFAGDPGSSAELPVDSGAVQVLERPRTATVAEEEPEGVSVADLLAEVEAHLRSVAEGEPAEAERGLPADRAPEPEIVVAATERPAPAPAHFPGPPPPGRGRVVPRARRSPGQRMLVAAGVGAALVVLARW